MMRCASLVPLRWLGQALACLPPRLLLVLSRGLTWRGWPWLARRRRVIAANLALCFPELSARERERLLRENLTESMMGVFELLRAWYAPAWRMRGAADVTGLEHLRAAMDSGRGVLILTGHFIQTELATRLLTDALGRRLRAVVRRHNHPCVEAELERARRRVVAAPTLAKKDLRGLLRALQSGEAVVYSADQDFSYAHVFVPFFGVPAATLDKPPELARRADAAMVFFHFHRDTGQRYRLHIEPEWPGWRDGTAEQAAAIYLRELERVVRDHPGQYLWAHRRFKTRPPGEPPVY